MATELISEATTKPRQFTLRDVMIWMGVLGFLWGVAGLAEWPKFCGNDATTYNLRRINLTELAAALHPAGLDDAVVPVAEINRLAANPSMWSGRGRVPVASIYEVRQVIKHRR